MKTCSCCNTEKEDCCFGDRKGVLRSQCNLCRTGKNREKRLLNPDECRQREREKYRANKEAICGYNRKNYQENVEERRAKSRESYKKNGAAKRARANAAYHGLSVEQKAARRAAARVAQRGLSLAQFQEMLQAQEHRCAICETVFLSAKEALIDHCHVTSVVRGLLCRKCNTGIGMLRDSKNLLTRAVAYLTK